MREGGVVQIGFAVLRTVLAEKTRMILAQLGDERGETDSDNAGWMQHVGFASRPSKAKPAKPNEDERGSAAEAVVVRGGDTDVVIASRDLRGLELYADLKDGETAIYAPGETGTGQARSLYKADGSIHHYTRQGNTKDGVGMTIQLDAQAGCIRLIDAFGNALISGPEGWKMTAGGSALTLSQSGDVTLVGTGQTQVDGAGILIGASGVTGVNSAIMGPAGIAGIANPKILLGMP